MRRFLFFLLIVVLGVGMLKSQDKYPVRGTVYIRDGKASKVSLSVLSGKKITRVPVDIDGNFTTYLDWDKNYQFCFSKPGYVGKKINFSTVVPGDIEKKYIYPYEILVELFPIFPHADTAFYKNPVAKIAYSTKINDFDYDLDYLLIVKEKTKAHKKQYYAWQKQIAPENISSQNTIPTPPEATARHNNKKVEIKSTVADTPEQPKVARTPESPVAKNKNQFGLPPVKKSYPDGKFIEVYPLKAKVITRVVIKNGNSQKVFYKVEHNWGGLYYFVEESPAHYRSISKYNFEKATKK